MLRIYFLQQWFNLSDPGVEEVLYESAVMRQFVGIDLGCEPVSDETTVCKFRHLLEEHQMGEQILGTVNLHLQTQGVRDHDRHHRTWLWWSSISKIFQRFAWMRAF
jgi:transposase, IS5 family